MKTRLLIIIGIVSFVAIILTSISLVYNQEIKIATGMMQSERPESASLSDPVCFAIDMPVERPIDNETIEVCYPLSDFESLGCTKPMVRHIYKYTNLFEKEFDDFFMQNLPGLPDGMSEEEYGKCLDAASEKRRLMAKNMEFESFSIVQGTEIELEGMVVDMRLGSAHQYSLFTNDPRFTFNTGSNGIKLVGLHDENDLNGKIIKLSGTRTQRDLGIYVNSYEITGSLIPPYENPGAANAKDAVDVSVFELYENPEKYYNRLVRVAGDLSEYEDSIAYAGVGCDTAKYEVSDDFSSDFPSSRHLKDGDKDIGVRIGTHDDLGKVKEALPDELKANKVTVMGIFVPSVTENGSCHHAIHKSGYVLTEIDEIKILGN